MSVSYQNQSRNRQSGKRAGSVADFFKGVRANVDRMEEGGKFEMTLRNGIDMRGVLVWARTNGIDARDLGQNIVEFTKPRILDPHRPQLVAFYRDAWDTISELPAGESAEFRTPDYVDPEKFANWLRHHNFPYSVGGEHGDHFRVARRAKIG